MLWVYRLHKPKIKLNSDVRKLIDTLKKNNATLVILTDGRSVTQRLKINALNLQSLPLFISEEYCSLKPNLLDLKVRRNGKDINMPTLRIIL